MTTVLGSNSNSANSALAQSISSIPSSNDIGGSNNTIANQKSEQQGQQLQEQQSRLPSSSSSSSSSTQQQLKSHEYTLIAENTTLEIAPGLWVDACTTYPI